jgi:putative membrane protein
MNSSLKLPPTLLSKLAVAAIAILAVNHAIGVVGLNVGSHRALFENVSWVNLLLSLLLVLGFQQPFRLKFFYWCLFTFSIGMAAEVMGVQTEFPFGSYYYTEKFGIQLLGVPLIIGVNWVLLSYCCGVLVQPYFSNHWLKIIAASLVMLALDLLLEPFAIRHQFWVWKNTNPPLQNFISWFVVSLPIQWAYFKLIPGNRNPISFSYLIILVLFLLADLAASRF